MNILRTSLPIVFLLFGVISALAAGSGEVTLIAGNVTMVPKGGGPAQKLKKGSKVEVGAEVTTDKKARVVIMMTDASAIRISGGSRVVIATMTDSGASGQSSVNVNLKSGSVGALIDSSKNRKIDFKIETPHGVATARGTYYAVVVEGGKTYTKVRNGQVSVTATPNQ